MNSAKVLEIFSRCGALQEGHFQLSSGLHSSGYLQCAQVLQHPRHAEVFGEALAQRVQGWSPGLVMSPALGGLIIGHEVARALNVRAIFAERHDGQLTLRRGFSFLEGERVVIIEDVVTTGKSTQETINLARHNGAVVVGAAAIIDRSGGNIDLGLEFEALASVQWPTHEPTNCPLCLDGMVITKPGSRPRP